MASVDTFFLNVLYIFFVIALLSSRKLENTHIFYFLFIIVVMFILLIGIGESQARYRHSAMPHLFIITSFGLIKAGELLNISTAFFKKLFTKNK